MFKLILAAGACLVTSVGAAGPSTSRPAAASRPAMSRPADADRALSLADLVVDLAQARARIAELEAQVDSQAVEIRNLTARLARDPEAIAAELPKPPSPRRWAHFSTKRLEAMRIALARTGASTAEYDEELAYRRARDAVLKNRPAAE